MKNKFNFNNKFVVIIGGSGLLGRRIVKDLIEQGAKVLNLDLKKNNKLKSQKLFFQNFDLKESDKIDEILKKIVFKHGCPDTFINAAYPRTKLWHKSTYEELTYSELEKNINMQLNSFIWSAMKIASLMKKYKKKGSIVILNSIYGKVSQNKLLYKGTNINFNPIYSAAKGGLLSFIKNLSTYYGEFGIRANSIICGGVIGHTSTTNKKLGKFFINKYSNNTSLKRMANPKDISESVLFLSSELSSYITGSELLVDGGYTST
jgi:NAD(P)-dependent dehydrogenase (short-subunit alcohol dehydrogenase family)